MNTEIINRFGGINNIPKFCTFCEYRHSCCSEGPKIINNDSDIPFFKRFGDCPDFKLGKCITCSMAGFDRPECINHQRVFDYQGCKEYKE